MTRRARIATVAAALTLAVILGGAAAAYFVRSTTEEGTPVYWKGGCTFITPDTIPPPELSLDEVLATLKRSTDNWQSRTGACSYLKINIDPPAANETKLDLKNVLKFRFDRWCHPADPTKNMQEVCYAPQAAAITTVFYNNDKEKPKDYASIMDADIELNTLNFTFVNLPSSVQPRTGTQLADFENTLTHELGHFMGLDHTCWDHTSTLHPLDDSGQPVPECGAVIAHMVPDDVYTKITQSTMFNYASPGETLKRTPEVDDVDAICRIYPSAKNPNQCTRVGESGCGCAVAAIADRKTVPAPIAAPPTGRSLSTEAPWVSSSYLPYPPSSCASRTPSRARRSESPSGAVSAAGTRGSATS